MNRTIPTFGLIIGAFCSPMVLAADGVIEINQARALAGGVTSGDTAGFPVSLNESGSYVLTSDLVVPANTEGIHINTGLTLDLNGFSVVGPVTCSNTSDLGSEVVCNANGATGGSGIAVIAENVVVKNGTVQGFFFRGIGNSGHQGNVRLDNVTVTENAVGGVGGCAAISFDDARSVVIHASRVFKNGACRAIELFDDSIISDTEIAENNGEGIFFFGGGNQVINSHVRHNSQSGIQLPAGFVSDADSGDNAVIDSFITENGGHGIDNDQKTLVLRGNVITGNAGLQVDDGFAGSGPVLDAGGNVCGNTAGCP